MILRCASSDFQSELSRAWMRVTNFSFSTRAMASSMPEMLCRVSRSERPRTTASRRASMVCISCTNESLNDVTPSAVSFSVMASRLKPLASNVASVWRASSTPCSIVSSTRP